MRKPRSYGLSRREQQIIDLHEAGTPTVGIAQQLGIDANYARSVVRDLSFESCWANSRAFDGRTRASSRRYMAAVAATGLHA